MPDVIIAGGGLAGSSLAVLLARQGKEVLLIDRANFPREKVCGEGLMPAGVAALERLGVPAQGAPFKGVRYRFAERCVAGPFPSVPGLARAGLGIRRKHLDAALWQAAAQESKVRVISGAKVDAPIRENGVIKGVVVEGTEYRAPLTVGADGANSILRHKLGWNRPIEPKRAGIRAHYRLAPGRPQEEWVDIFLDRHREIYVTPLPDSELLVALLTSSAATAQALREAIAANRQLAEWLEGAELLDAPMGAAPLCVRATRRAAAGCVLVGDAAGNCDPVTGGGMSQALLSVELLAGHLSKSFPPSEQDLLAFDRERERMLADYRRLTAMVLSLSRRDWLIPPALAALHAWPALFSHLVGVAGGVRPLWAWPASPWREPGDSRSFGGN